MNLYNLQSLAPNQFQMAKFDSDFNVAAVYNLAPKGSGYTCDCPANNRTVILRPCKHKKMLPLMLGAVNTDRFYDPESRSWCQPLDASEWEPQPLEAEGRQESVTEAGAVTGRFESDGSHIEEVTRTEQTKPSAPSASTIRRR